MIINVHAGHNPDGMKGCGAVGIVKESTEVRKIKDEVIKLLQFNGHTAYDCTCDNGKDSSDVLKQIVSKCNAHTVDLDVSIHLNACVNDRTGDGKTTGTEVYVYRMKDEKGNETVAYKAAKRITNEISEIGYRNRGVKVRTGLYVLRHTKAPALLIECFFCDDKDDVNLYDVKEIAHAIVCGILNQDDINTEEPPKPTPEPVKPEPPKPVAKPEPVKPSVPSLKGYKGGSIVDGLKKFGYPSDFNSRAGYYYNLGYKDKYKGTALQNIKMLKALKSR